MSLRDRICRRQGSVRTYRQTLRDLESYTDHQREQNPRQYEAGVGTDEYARLDQRVTDAEQRVPWWRRR